MPRSLYLPDDKEALSYGSKKYASAGTIKRDYEAGEWDSPLIYVRLLTQNTSIRETFVPSKAYKFASTYWHLIGIQFLEKCEFAYSNQTLAQLDKIFQERFVPCRSLDLKGEALMMPREYFLIIFEEIIKIFPCDELRENFRVVKYLFDNFRVVDLDTGFEEEGLIRGIGLGYFNSIKAILSCSLMMDMSPVHMFADDMLIPQLYYLAAREILTEHSLIINDKKSGIRYINACNYVRMIYTRKYKCFAWGNKINSILSAVFGQQHHFQRKSVARDCTTRQKLILAKNYPYIWGSEFFLGDCFQHVDQCGIMTEVSRIVGHSRFVAVKRQISPEPSITTRIGGLPHRRWLDIDSAKIYQSKRRAAYKAAIMEDSILYELDHPKLVHELDPFYLRKNMMNTPDWVELQLLFTGKSTGKYRYDLTIEEYEQALQKYPESHDPAYSFLQGGYENISFRKTPSSGVIPYESLRKMETLYMGESEPHVWVANSLTAASQQPSIEPEEKLGDHQRMFEEESKILLDNPYGWMSDEFGQLITADEIRDALRISNDIDPDDDYNQVVIPLWKSLGLDISDVTA